MTHDDDPFVELKSTGALILLFAAVVGAALGAVEWGSGGAVAATSICVAAAAGFALSVAWFVSDGRHAQRAQEANAELPFPSWLRNEADA